MFHAWGVRPYFPAWFLHLREYSQMWIQPSFWPLAIIISSGRNCENSEILVGKEPSRLPLPFRIYLLWLQYFSGFCLFGVLFFDFSFAIILAIEQMTTEGSFRKHGKLSLINAYVLWISPSFIQVPKTDLLLPYIAGSIGFPQIQSA